MPTPAERNALLFLATVATIGGGVRLVGASRFAGEVTSAERLATGPTDRTFADKALRSQIAAVDSARTARNRRAPRSPRASAQQNASQNASNDAESSSGEQVPRISSRNASARLPLVVDVNRATQAELERLPRVGPALAARIIAWREQHGPYRSIEDLRHVRGIGATTAALLAPAVTF
jgi:competence ComEA-like helix-hairpin-helix protein